MPFWGEHTLEHNSFYFYARIFLYASSFVVAEINTFNRFYFSVGGHALPWILVCKLRIRLRRGKHVKWIMWVIRKLGFLGSVTGCAYIHFHGNKKGWNDFKVVERSTRKPRDPLNLKLFRKTRIDESLISLFTLCRMSQERPSSRDGTSKLLNHVLMQPSPMQYINNNNTLILNKNNFLAIDTPNNSNFLNKNNCNVIMTTTPASVPSPSVNYMSKEAINCF